MNKESTISEREFELINIIADGISSNQRALSSRVGISLGMTNLLLKRLVTKGYLRARQLNAKKVDYLLTPRGFAEKAKKSYRYTLKTLNSFALLKTQIQVFFREQLAQGRREFVVLGNSDLLDLLELSVRGLDHGLIKLRRVASAGDIGPAESRLVIYGEEAESPLPKRVSKINLLEALASHRADGSSRLQELRSENKEIVHA